MSIDDDKTMAFRIGLWLKTFILLVVLTLVALTIRAGITKGEWLEHFPVVVLLVTVCLEPFKYVALIRVWREWRHESRTDTPRRLWSGLKVTLLHRAVRAVSSGYSGYEVTYSWVVRDDEGERYVVPADQLVTITDAVDLLGDLVTSDD